MVLASELGNSSTLRCRMLLRLAVDCERDSFSCRLNVPRSLAISAARAADFSTSISELRQGWLDSIWLNRSEVWPRILVSALLKSSDTVRASCKAQSSFCLCARVNSVLPGGSEATISGRSWNTKNLWPSRLKEQTETENRLAPPPLIKNRSCAVL